MITVKWKLRSSLTIVALMVLAVCVGAWQKANVPEPDSRVRQIYLALDPYQSGDDSQFWIRVTEHPDAKGDAFIAGSFYFFDSGPSETGPWTNIMTGHLDDPDPIPTSNVVFVNSRVGYVFLYHKLAVSTDAGRSWSTWELAQGNPEWRPKRAMIRNVILSADGSGEMVVQVFASSTKVKLRTHDFGKNWTPGKR